MLLTNSKSVAVSSESFRRAQHFWSVNFNTFQILDLVSIFLLQ